MRKLYLYLASRSKKGIKLVTTLTGESIVTSKITDLTKLDLPAVWARQIEKIINDNKMLYEPWIESANSYEELKQRLKVRGFSELPIGPMPMINMPNGELPKADTSSCKVKTTMLRKKKD